LVVITPISRLIGTPAILTQLRAGLMLAPSGQSANQQMAGACWLNNTAAAKQ
jgi:hypothetical protein